MHSPLTLTNIIAYACPIWQAVIPRPPCPFNSNRPRCLLGPGALDPIDPERVFFIHKMACLGVTSPQYFSTATTLSCIVPTSSTFAIVS